MNNSQEISQLIEYYESMLLLRRFEEKAGQLYGMGLIGGFCHLYIGQEAVAVGIQSTLKKGDALITSYRDHGIMLSIGSDPKCIMAELLGRTTGCSKGKGGSMHMFDLTRSFYGGHGIVGAQVPIGTGVAFANKYQGKDNVVITIFGDGAANQGQVYESFNMAKLWNLPVVYVVENNQYAMGTSVAKSSSTTEFYKRGEAFGIIGKKVDGMDVLAVRSAMLDIIDFVRSKSEPVLVEMVTYRYRGHSMSDPAQYRSREEVALYRENHDPITLLHDYIISKNLATDSTFAEAEKRVKALIEKAVQFAKNSPEPAKEELYTEIYPN